MRNTYRNCWELKENYHHYRNHNHRRCRSRCGCGCCLENKVILFEATIIVELTFGTCNDWTALILTFLHYAIMSNGLRERTYTQIAHEHLIVARTIQTGLICHDSIAFIVMIIVVVAAFCKFRQKNNKNTELETNCLKIYPLYIEEIC